MAFCTAEDVASRLARTFTDAQEAQAEFLCDAATGVIAAAADKTDDWADAYDAPRIIRHLAIELVARTMRNPDSLRSFSETLGAYQHTEGFQSAAAGGGMALTEVETLLVRRTVYGRTSGSSRPESTATELHDLVYGDCS